MRELQGFGDRGSEGSHLNGKDRGSRVNDSHSVFLWQAGSKVYLVGVDNIELHDVDIFDMSEPAKPKPVAERDLLELFAVDTRIGSANNNNMFHHDVVVKRIDGRQVMFASYWDAGYVSWT